MILGNGVLVHDGKFLVYLTKPPTIVCQGYLTNRAAALSLQAYAEPTDTYNLYTITMPTTAQSYKMDAKRIDEVYRVIDEWREPGHQPYDAKYDKMPYRE
jgi:hypothetical protein